MIVVALKVVIHSALLAIESCKAFFFLSLSFSPEQLCENVSVLCPAAVETANISTTEKKVLL